MELEPGQRRVEWSTLAAVASGGALGAAARFGISQAIHSSASGFPWNTLVTNVSGSFAIGLLVWLNRRAFVVTGFLGGFTTYSTFAVETDVLVNNGHAVVGFCYAAASLVAGFLAVWIGMLAARAVRPGRPSVAP